MNLPNNGAVLATVSGLFDNTYLDTKKLFITLRGALPSIAAVYTLRGEKAYAAFLAQWGTLVTATHQYRWHNAGDKKTEFNRTVVELSNGCMVEFDDNYAEVLHDGSQAGFVAEVVAVLSRHKEPQRRQPREINLIIRGHDGLELKGLEIKRTRLDLGLFYNDDFVEVDSTIRARLTKKKDKGIILLHGPPGTGKTTYLRHLIGKIKKRVLFLSPSAAGDLVNPDFVELLIDNPNTVVVIEDAETVISDRRVSQNTSAVSNLLNISDGLLADFLNVQLICTFNSPLTMVDPALMRNGRLIAKYEFGPLSVAKAQRLSQHLGHARRITEPMTLAEIANPNEKAKDPSVHRETIGFRRADAIRLSLQS